jgi:hypothetical protein
MTYTYADGLVMLAELQIKPGQRDAFLGSKPNQPLEIWCAH